MSLLTSHEDNVFTIIFNNPEKHNSFDDRFILEFTDILNKINNNLEISLVMIKANGKHFSAGADLNWMKSMANYTEEENKQDAMQLATMLQTLHQLSKPTIAITHGKTFGGGVGILACCDYVIALPDAQFCLSEVKLGLSPAVISPYITQAMGNSQARRYCLTGEIFHAEQARNLNLIHDIIPEDKLNNYVLNLQKQFSLNCPIAMAETKKLINKPIENYIVQETVNTISALRISPSAQQKLKVFLEKKK